MTFCYLIRDGKIFHVNDTLKLILFDIFNITKEFIEGGRPKSFSGKLENIQKKYYLCHQKSFILSTFRFFCGCARIRIGISFGKKAKILFVKL